MNFGLITRALLERRLPARGSVPGGYVFSASLAAAILAAAVLAAPLSCSRPEPPALTPEVARVTAVTPQGLELDVQVRVDNPNAFPLLAERVAGTLYVGGDQKLGDGVAKPGSSIPARGSALVPSRIQVRWADVSVLGPLLLREAVPYTFRGDVTLGGEDLNVTLPFSLTGQLSRSQLLSAGLRGLSSPP